MRSYGTIKWFGGINNTTGKENKFGFITDFSKSDIYLNLRDWNGDDAPNEGDLVAYNLISDNSGKSKALSAFPFYCLKIEHDEANSMLVFLDQTSEMGGNPHQIFNQFNDYLKSYLYSISLEDLNKFLSDNRDSQKLFSILCGTKDWARLLSDLNGSYGREILDIVPFNYVPIDFVIENEESVAKWLSDQSGKQFFKNIELKNNILPNSLILYLVAVNKIALQSDLGTRWTNFCTYLISMVFESKKDYPKYVDELVNGELKNKGGLRENALVGPLIDQALYKKYLFNKSEKSISLFYSSSHLKNIPENMVLNSVFESILAGNELDVVYSVFFDKMWGFITHNQITPGLGLDMLFPSCYSMPSNLSCEAVFWENQNLYLCRGKKCSNPSVIPNLSKSYLNFNIYDWFKHYGIKYSKDDQPSRTDFPIKVAGFLNRLVEIFPLIHCRSCGDLMLPDLKYARVKRTYFENGQWVTENLSAAYRCTVFYCRKHTCNENGKGHYISHCLGGCSAIIDSRDHSAKCDSGRIICKECGSCCSECGKSNPDGLCAKCSSPLVIYENVSETAPKFKNRFVQCKSKKCDFYIPSQNLSKRFYLKTSSPPRKVKTSGPVK